MNECRYELKQPFQYSYKGEMVEASFVTMTAPNFSQVDKVTPIKQAFATAMKEKFAAIGQQEIQEAQEIAAAEAKEDSPPEEDTGIDASFVMTVMFQWSGNMTNVFRNAEALFKAGAAKVEGETPFTRPLFEKMSMSDFEGMVGAYLANFIVPSLTDGQ